MVIFHRYHKPYLSNIIAFPYSTSFFQSHPIISLHTFFKTSLIIKIIIQFFKLFQIEQAKIKLRTHIITVVFLQYIVLNLMVILLKDNARKPFNVERVQPRHILQGRVRIAEIAHVPTLQGHKSTLILASATQGISRLRVRPYKRRILVQHQPVILIQVLSQASNQNARALICSKQSPSFFNITHIVAYNHRSFIVICLNQKTKC